MLKNSLLGLGVLSNLATLVGVWITFISAPATVQSHVARVLLIAGAGCSVALYLLLAWFGLRPRHLSPDKGAPGEHVRPSNRFRDVPEAAVKASDPTHKETEPEVLKGKILQLARDLFAFLREKGPKPEPRIDNLMSFEEKVEVAWDATGPYVNAIHYGWERRFKQQVIDTFNELREHSIEVPKIPELQSWEINPPHGQNEERITKIAETLFLMAATIDIEEAAKGTTSAD